MKSFVILSFLVAATKASPWDDLNVTIAVVEYKPITDSKLSKFYRILANTGQYMNFMSTFNESLDMIIFPEDTLRNDPETAVELKLSDNPCDNKDSFPVFIYDLSCAARKASTYLVINLVQKIKCDNTSQSRNCKNHGYFFYNTDVAFDRNGTVVGLYHKYNLFGEIELDRPPQSEEVVILTDFGVNFGIFTCFDIMFKSPAQDLLQKDVDAVIFPSMWFSQLPFLTALQTQEMWAHAHNITLFGAGANNPSVGSGGTGVYDGANGVILDTIVGQGGSQALVYKHTKGKPPQPIPEEDTDALAKDMDKFHISVDPSVINYSSTVLDTKKKTVSEQVCFNGGEKNSLCCNFNIKLAINSSTNEEKKSYIYHLVAYSGTRPFNKLRHGGIEICGVIACLNSSLTSCGKRFLQYEDIEWPITFEKIEITSNFEKNENKTQFPNSLLSSIRPVRASQTLWKEQEVEVDGEIFIKRNFSLTTPQNRILTFAIFGRNFAEDSPPTGGMEGGSVKTKSIGVAWILMVSAGILTIFAFK